MVDTLNMSAIEDNQSLEAFVVDNDDLDKLESLIDQFNIFEALGVVRQELRHSDFLAFLLDPRQNHRLGDAFARRLLQKILVAARDLGPAISPIHVNSWDFSQLTVRREWQNIDILLVDPLNHLVVVIENKISTTEHSNQLARYLRLVEAEFSNAEWKCLAIYLTPDGETPSLNEYLPADYGLVASSVEAQAELQRLTLDPAVHELMVHYAQMLRRHIVADSEIADLCHRIYRRHQRALDLIFEHRPDRLAQIQAILVELVRSRNDFVLDTASKQVVRFAYTGWEELPRGSGWTRSGRMVLFEFDNYHNRLDLSLYIGPGPAKYRQALIEKATAHQPPFRVRNMGGREGLKFKTVYSRRFLTLEELQDSDLQEIEARIRERWESFVDTDLPALAVPIRDASLALALSPAEEVGIGESE